MLNRILWKYFIRRTAKAHGFLDPMSLFSRLSQFSQPSEVLAPTELLRATAVLHARGLLNAQVIQHNLDWVWPFWVSKQFDPNDASFIPRSFSLTHINLTHRNWTAVGLPDFEETPLVDPRGLVTPFWDGWSIDAWIVNKEGKNLIPSKLDDVQQNFDVANDSIITESSLGDLNLTSTVKMIKDQHTPFCQIDVSAQGSEESLLVVSVRPCNPEGVSLIKHIELCGHKAGWKINKTQEVYLSSIPQSYAFSDYHDGDVYHHLFKNISKDHIQCPVEMSSAAAIFPLGKEKTKELTISIPLQEDSKILIQTSNHKSWGDVIKRACQIDIPDEQFQFLFETSLRTMLIHTTKDVFAGPYTYKRFWFRDAVFISYALLCCGLHKRVEGIINQFEKRQKMSGYFESQEGEWDSNGQVLWLIQKYCQMTNQPPKKEWQSMITNGARWIVKKRLPGNSQEWHAGLMPSGFSAEHFGPNNYYYWDNFWSHAGIKAADYLFQLYGENDQAQLFFDEDKDFAKSIEKSLDKVEGKMKSYAMPSSPYRRLDTASVGSLVAGYPLQLWNKSEKRLVQTAEYLFDHCLVHNGLFHDMSHSGINPYLTLHIAQVFLRAGDLRYFSLMKGIADLASPTGQWPEAIHPQTKGGCMGDGQHTWAAAEWIMMLRNCFVREEEIENTLLLCSGVPIEWLRQAGSISFGPTSTIFGNITLRIKSDGKVADVQWQGDWHKEEPQIAINLPEKMPVRREKDGYKVTLNID